jgi:hypothetical protein
MCRRPVVGDGASTKGRGAKGPGRLIGSHHGYITVSRSEETS